MNEAERPPPTLDGVGEPRFCRKYTRVLPLPKGGPLQPEYLNELTNAHVANRAFVDPKDLRLIGSALLIRGLLGAFVVFLASLTMSVDRRRVSLQSLTPILANHLGLLRIITPPTDELRVTHRTSLPNHLIGCLSD